MSSMERRPNSPRRGIAMIASALLGLFGCGVEGGAEPWDGTLKSGVLAMADASGEGDVDGALAIADRMLAPGATAQLRQKLNRATRGTLESVLSPVTSVLDLVGVSALSSADRAEIEYARAVALLTGAAAAEENAPGLIERAQMALERARAAAPGEARMGAVYNLGTLDLLAAEAVRATIPEIAGADAAAPAAPAAPPDPNQKDDAEEDPLPIARALYLLAREDFVELLTQAADENAAANVELVIRRLAELDEIEKQREEQESGGEKGDESEESEDSEDQEDQEKEDSEKSDESEDKPSDEENPEQQDPSEDPSEEEPEEEEPQEEPEESPEEGEEAEPEEPDDQPKPGEEQIEEKTMTVEEFQRLLERNKEHQERGEEIRRIRLQSRKIPAKRDW
ncbi:MAG: chemotaxis protein histidine kinase CheA [Planctomycetota bacterium]|jgi:chemotaxis protein histidine kinase CheA